MSSYADYIAQLSPKKRALLEMQLRNRKAASSKQHILPHTRDSNIFALSFAQERLWVLNQLTPGSAFYNIPGAVRLQGSLQIGALEQSLNAIMRRHETLRTTFITVEGQPRQVIASELHVPLGVVDLRGLGASERDAHVQQLAAAEAWQPFDLVRGPLLRTRLLRLAEAEHVLLLTLHHIVCDGWSIGVFIRELGVLYQAFINRQPAALADLPIQYADFALWQRESLPDDVLETHLAYWRQQLDGAPAVLELPADHPRPAVQTFRGATQRSVLPAPLYEALETLSRRQGVTLFMTLLTALQTLLWRYTGQDDVVVGSPIANRTRSELENLIGCFVNMLVLRTDLSGNPTFAALLSRVREVALGAYTHQDLPFEKLVEELQPVRDLSRAPLFQITFQLQNALIPPLALEGLALRRLPIDSGTTQMDLSLDMGERDEGFVVFVEYSTDLFEATTIARLVQHFQTLLAGIVVHPERCLSELALLSPCERQQLLVEWNDTSAAYLPDRCLHELFERQVERTPEASALVFDGRPLHDAGPTLDAQSPALSPQHLTYRELNQRANQLAHHLRGMGVGPEVRVGICMERSPEMVVGLLGVLKAGGAYVPLTPTYPQERLAFVLADAQVSVLLTQQHLAAGAPAHGAQVVCLDADWPTVAQACAANPSGGALPGNVAYTIYTSGSTGRPKGVLIAHTAVANHAIAVGQRYGLRANDRVLQFASLSFDVAVEEIFASLLKGAALIIPPDRTLAPNRDFLGVIQKGHLTVLNLPSSFWHAWVRELSRSGEPIPASLRLMIVGSEPIAPEQLVAWQKLAGARSIWMSAYGTTEAAITTTLYTPPLRSADARLDAHVPIGSPLANMHIYILDAQLRPVPIGVAGELHIGGAGVARGYLNRPDLTAERFVPNPFAATNDERRTTKDDRDTEDRPFVLRPSSFVRLYKTGDWARYRPDGAIEYLRRIDQQVKLRGFRIELGEIESVLRQTPAVRQAVVVVREDQPGEKCLVAYVEAERAHDQAQRAELEVEWTSYWQKVHDEELFNQTAPDDAPTFNISGWNSSYTDQPLPAEEMRVWVDSTVERILSAKPQRVLEIGCGTGLLLFRIAPHCSHYCGTDFSPTALDYIRQQLAQPEQALPQVTLLERNADDFAELAAQSFDAVILNSVVQYFPSVDYLLQVLEGAVKVLKPGGALFIGDVRNLSLLASFHASVELQRAPASLSKAQLVRRMHKQLLQDPELVIDPAFFVALRQHFSEIGQVEIQLKRGRYDNELTKYRYDAMLTLGPQLAPAPELAWLDWQKQRFTLPAVRQLLTEHEPLLLGLRSVPNARLLADLRIVEWLSGQGGPETAGAMREALSEAPALAGVEPEDLWELGRDLSYNVTISWSGPGADGCYDVLFKRQPGLADATLTDARSVAQATAEARPWRSYTNNPLLDKMASRLVPELRRALKEQLPDYMLPSAFVLLDALPLTPSGKLDRRALPDPDAFRSELTMAYVAPRTDLERAIVVLWQEALRIEKVSTHDNFFDLGGHSLLVVQVHGKLRQILNRDVSIIELFQYPTISSLAKHLQSEENNGQPLLQQSNERADVRRESTKRQREMRQRQRYSKR
jgi:amino acid adenylation domain-containing protein